MSKQNSSRTAQQILEEYKNVPFCVNSDGQVPNDLTRSFITEVLNYFDDQDIKTIADIGARDAAQSVELAYLFPDAWVNSFEPSPANVSYCKQNLAKTDLPNIVFIECALSDVDETVSFFEVVNGNFGASSLFEVNQNHKRARKWKQDQVFVEARRYDSLDIPTPDLIWMDVQGAELNVLKGFGKKINDVKAICTEVQHQDQYQGGTSADELHSFLDKNNFKMIKEEWIGSNRNTRLESDRIYINKEYIK